MDKLKEIEELLGLQMQIVYTVDSKDKIRFKAIAPCYQDDVPGVHYTDGLIDSENMKEPIFKASKPKNIGKANEISAERQAELMCDQHIGKAMRSNYFITPEIARENKLWLPMLCPSGMKWKDYAKGGKKEKDVTYPALASPKLDGARCNIFLKNGEVYAQTRTGKEWLNVNHIKEVLKPFFDKNPNYILDGELYNHDYKDNFEDLMSIIKKQKPTEEQRLMSKKDVEYHIYDIFDTNDIEASALKRAAYLNVMFGRVNPNQPKFGNLLNVSNVIKVDNKLCYNEQQYDEFHTWCLEQGYEGSILRLDDVYKVDGRAKQLLKRKELFDCEMKILDVIEGEGTNKGIAAKVIVDLTSCHGMPEEHWVRIVNGEQTEQDAGMAKGWDHDKCRDLLERKDEVIGKMATIEYFEITGHGICRFPKMKTIRDYE